MRGRLRAGVAAGILFAIFGGLLYRLYDIQVASADRYRRLAFLQQRPSEAIPAYRGDVRTADGVILARSVICKSAFAEPRRLDGDDDPDVEPEKVAAAADAIGRALGYDQGRIRALRVRLLNPRVAAFCWIERRLEPERAARLAAAKVPGVGFREEYRREYPGGPLAAHLIGLVELDGDGEIAGRSGIEKAFDRDLAGVRGYRELLRDGAGRRFFAADEDDRGAEILPEHGATVTLTIDAAVQRAVEGALERACLAWKPDGASAIVLRVRDGAVLALACRPTYDPSRLADTVTPAAIRNRAIENVFEPGSILKPLVLAAALDAGVIATLEEAFTCAKSRVFGRKLVTDEGDGPALGTVPVSEVMVYSSNVGMVQVAERLGPARLRDLLLRCGFGEPLGTFLPYEAGGHIRSAEAWKYQDTVSVGMGYAVNLTQVQIASAFAALAGDGVRFRPRLIQDLSDARGRIYRAFPPEVLGRVVEAETAARLRPVLAEVVRRGTGRRARMEGYEIAGKTGTAKKIDPVTGRYVTGQYVASFCAYAPADRPEIVVIVSVDHPRGDPKPFGGKVAAPVVREILEEVLPYLGVAPSPPPAAPASGD